MPSKCYPIVADFLPTYEEKQVPSDGKWRVFCRTSENVYVLVQNISGEIKVSLMFVYSFPLLAPHHLLEAEKFNLRFTDPSQMTFTADKLRWYRYKKALLQREVAAIAGIDRSTYIHYEDAARDYYPLEIMEKIAPVLGVHVTELLDDFNMFLYNNQGKQIREKRTSLGMTQAEYARYLGVNLGNLKKWEQNKVRIFKSTWEKHFK